MNNHPTFTKILSIFLLVSLLSACSLQPNISSLHTDRQAGATAGKPSAAFVPNPGFADASILFRTLGGVGTFFFEQQQVVFPLLPRNEVHPWFSRLMKTSTSDASKATQPLAVRLQFVGANPNAKVAGQEQLPGIVNYFLGNDPTKWKAGVPTYGSITYQGLYPGIDLVYSSGEGVLKGSYVVAPGASPDDIEWRYDGASWVKLDKSELLIGTDETSKTPTFVEGSPVAWQTVDGNRTSVRVKYVVHSDGSIGFSLSAYDTTKPLVIDPEVELVIPEVDYGTYWGGIGCDGAYHMAVDSSNKIYITGATNTQGYPHTNSNCDETEFIDVFIVKLDPTLVGAAQNIYTTFIIGSDYDIAAGIGVDSSGKAYVVGSTQSTDLPFTSNAYQKTHHGGMMDAMAIQLNATGGLQYLSYLGGNQFEESMQVSVSGGLMHLVGLTYSPDFPITPNAYSSTIADGDAFVSVLDTSKSGNASLVYSTYFGGSDVDEGYAIAANNGVIYFAGTTKSDTDLPLKNPVQNTFGGGGGYGDVFAAILNRSLSGTNQLLFATYLGGSENEIPGGVTPYGTQIMYVTGATGSSDFPRTIGPSFGGETDAFLTKLDVVDPTNLVYSRFIGGNGDDGFREVKVDIFGNTYLAGYTGSSNLPTVDPIQNTFQGGAAVGTDSMWFTSPGPVDAMVGKCSLTGTITFLSYLGGTGADGAFGLSLNSNGRVYVVGGTRSTDFPFLTINPFQGVNAGQYDAFIVGIDGLYPEPLGILYLPIIKQ